MNLRYRDTNRVTGCLLLILVTSAAACAEGTGTEPAWKPLAAKAGVQDGSIRARSPIIAHERAVKFGEEWKLDKNVILFEHKGKSLNVTIRWSIPGSDRKTSYKDSVQTLVKLKAFGEDYGFWLRLDPDGERVRVSSAYGIKVPFGRDAAYLLDSDFDGTLGSAGDGVIVPGSRTVGPMQLPVTQIWTPEDAIQVRKNADGTWSMAPIAMPKPDDRDHSAAWRYFLWERQACGLLAVEYHAELEGPMRAHANYLALNHAMGHEENAGSPGYSAEGNDAGTTSLLGWGRKTYLGGVQGQLATLIHRSGALSPNMSGSALLLSQGTFFLSWSKIASSPLSGRVLVYPPHGMTNVACRSELAMESPCPVDDRNKPLGTAVGIFTHSLIFANSPAEKPTLTLVPLDAAGNAGPAVEGEFHYPGRGAGGSTSTMGNIALIPGSPLRPETRYRATISALLPKGSGSGAAARGDSVPFTYEWEFETGKDVKPGR